MQKHIHVVDIHSGVIQFIFTLSADDAKDYEYIKLYGTKYLDEYISFAESRINQITPQSQFKEVSTYTLEPKLLANDKNIIIIKYGIIGAVLGTIIGVVIVFLISIRNEKMVDPGFLYILSALLLILTIGLIYFFKGDVLQPGILMSMTMLLSSILAALNIDRWQLQFSMSSTIVLFMAILSFACGNLAACKIAFYRQPISPILTVKYYKANKLIFFLFDNEYFGDV